MASLFLPKFSLEECHDRPHGGVRIGPFGPNCQPAAQARSQRSQRDDAARVGDVGASRDGDFRKVVERGLCDQVGGVDMKTALVANLDARLGNIAHPLRLLD